MKLADIPQAIQGGDWECCYSLKGLVKYIEELIDGETYGKKLNMEPDFQRGHVWTEEQQIAYIEAILQNRAQNARVVYLNDPEWTGQACGEYKDMVCVDGLQRYTAIKRFVNNEIKAFGLYLNEYEDAVIFNRKPIVKLNVNRLQTREEVLKWYLEINSGGTPHTEQEIARVRKLYEDEIASNR